MSSSREAALRISTSIKELRKSHGMSQLDFAALTGVSHTSVAQVEVGHQVPRVDSMLKLLRPFGKTLAIVDLDE